MSHKHKHEHPESPGGAAQAQAAPGQAAAQPTSDDAAPVGAALASPRPDLAALQAERDDLLNRLQRVSADYLNYQKRIQKEVQQSREFANEEIIKAILPILDDFEKAIEAASAGRPADDPLLAGVRLIHDKTLTALGRFGLATISCVGEAFDPARHSAVLQEPGPNHAPGTVARELRKGYTMHGRLLRPAMVTVA
jgi:molecular chaperone GrpE